MSSDKETAYYIELQPGDKVQVWDQWLDQFGQWQFYTCTGGTEGVVGHGVKARRPIGKTNQTTYEEVPGSRTTQQAIDQPQRERIAYEELQPGTEVQAGDQYRNTQGRWVEYSMDTSGVPIVGPTAMARRPHKITALQDERDELKTALRESHAAHAFTTKQGLAACKERDEACRERDLARSEVARLSTELWARKPLEERIASLTHELANAAVDGYNLQHERDETRAELQRLQEVVGNLHSEPTARQVQDMLRTWATELDWSAGCFDSAGRDKVSAVQRVLVAVIERIEGLINPEGGIDGE